MSQIKTISSVIGTAGHVDHGKTSLVRALTGIDTEKKEEKRRGLTIDLGFAYMDFPSPDGRVRVGVVDVPGHERFIRNMLSGITGVDTVLFVVSAPDGVMPQTIEHFQIIRLLGIERVIFVITKKDLAGPERVEEAMDEVRGLVKGSLLEGSPVIAVSTVTGEGLEELRGLIRKGIEGRRRREEGFFRLPVDRVFPVKGFGTVVTGTVISGSVKRGEEVISFPEGRVCRVKGIESLRTAVEEAGAGSRAALNISGLSHGDVRRGFVFSSPELLSFAGVRRVDCFLDLLPGERKMGSVLKLHHLTGDTLVRVLFAGKQKSGGVFGRVILRKPLLMLRGDRFILRDPSRNETIGGGVVHLPYLSKEVIPVLGEKDEPGKGEGPNETLTRILPAKGAGFPVKLVSLMLNVSEGSLGEALEGGDFSRRGGFVVSSGRLLKLRERVLSTLSSHHSKNPSAAGVKEDEVLKALDGEFSRGLEGGFPVLLKSILDEMINSREIRREGALLTLPSFAPALKGVDAEIERELKKLFRGAGHVTVEEIKKLPFRPQETQRVLEYLRRKGDVVKVTDGAYISGEFASAARSRLVEHITSKGSIRAAEFRDMVGCGRKLAIELLEYFDRVKLTLRQGDVRILHPGAGGKAT